MFEVPSKKVNKAIRSAVFLCKKTLLFVFSFANVRHKRTCTPDKSTNTYFLFLINLVILFIIVCINQTASPPPLVPLATTFVTTMNTFALPSMTTTIPHLVFFSNLPSSFSLCITDSLEQNHHGVALCRICF